MFTISIEIVILCHKFRKSSILFLNFLFKFLKSMEFYHFFWAFIKNKRVYLKEKVLFIVCLCRS
ncbi:MAG: hypothetical protein A2167_00755 [Planctomycetes bacterium RBG_13_46_10]|nr:MAG: hypothetical protein A2167_00755 [Planctomycetes bacterium RBG_13_46_10]